MYLWNSGTLSQVPHIYLPFSSFHSYDYSFHPYDYCNKSLISNYWSVQDAHVTQKLWICNLQKAWPGSLEQMPWSDESHLHSQKKLAHWTYMQWSKITLVVLAADWGVTLGQNLSCQIDCNQGLCRGTGFAGAKVGHYWHYGCHGHYGHYWHYRRYRHYRHNRHYGYYGCYGHYTQYRRNSVTATQFFTRVPPCCDILPRQKWSSLPICHLVVTVSRGKICSLSVSHLVALKVQRVLFNRAACCNSFRR